MDKADATGAAACVAAGAGGKIDRSVSGLRKGNLSMSMDKSLKKGGDLTRARNVLTRAERLAVLQEDERWTPAQGIYNLPKTKYRRLAPGQSGPKRPEAQG